VDDNEAGRTLLMDDVIIIIIIIFIHGMARPQVANAGDGLQIWRVKGKKVKLSPSLTN
jgi:hypothetical protein